MGFIDYHGTKEDRFSEVLEYSHAQQKEDWKYKQSLRIRKWLEEMMVDGSMAGMFIQDLLKAVILRYKELCSLKETIENDVSYENGIDSEQLWKDFTLDLIRRHLDPFHMDLSQRNKHFDTFLIKIFKINEFGESEEFFNNYSRPEYRKYLTECFDPTWKDQQFYKKLFELCKINHSKIEVYESFLNIYRMLGLSIALYLNQAIQPLENGWMMQESAEWDALVEIEGKIKKGSLTASDINKIRNPICDEREKTGRLDIRGLEPGSNTEYNCTVSGIPQSKLRREKFKEYLSNGNISSYVNACALLMECDMPDEIKGYYDQLISRMPVLQDSISKFDEIYHADMDQFMEYFAPETLQLTAKYLDYRAAEPSEKTLREMKENVLVATRKLLQVVNEKIDEIYKFVAIDAKAEAKALEAIMTQDGYVDPSFLIGKNGGNDHGKQ